MSQNYLSHDIWSCVGKPNYLFLRGALNEILPDL